MRRPSDLLAVDQVRVWGERRGDELVGRGDELAVIAGFLEPRSPDAVLLLRGEPGIGKTRLWEEGDRLAAAAGRRVLRATATANETALPYTVLADLLAGVAFDDVPHAQRQALTRVCREAGSAGERLVAAGLLNVLASLAQQGPVVVAIDDLQWVDIPTARALGLAIRRLETDAIRLLVSGRSGAELPFDLPRDRARIVEVGPLSLGAIHRLLNERLAVSLRRPVVHRIHAASGGNPLFALEIARGLGPQVVSLHGLEVLPPVSLGAAITSLLAGLASPCLAALRAAAVMESPMLDLIERSVPGGAAALDPAVEAGIVALDGPHVRFVHPLYREGAIASMRPSELRALHDRLALLVADPVARARHRARAAIGPDEELASALEAAASDELDSGSAALAASLAEDALTLGDGSPSTDRVSLAARAHLAAGDVERARTLLLDRLPLAAAGDERARIYLLLGQSIGTGQELLGYPSAAVEEAREPALRAEALLDLASSSIFVGVEDVPLQLERLREASELLEPADPLHTAAAIDSILISALAGLARPALDPQDGEAETFYLSVQRALGLAEIWRGDLAAARPIFEAGLAQARERGEDESVTSALLQLAEIAERAGRVEDAMRFADAAALGAGTDEGLAMAYRIRAAARHTAASPTETISLAAEAVSLASAGRFRWQELEARRIAGATALLAGDHVAARTWLEPVHEHLERNGVFNPGAFPVAADLAEAHLLAGRADQTERIVAELERRACEQAHPWARTAAGRVRGLLLDAAGDVRGAESTLRGAASAAEPAGLELDAARAKLALGVVLRHAKQRGDARAVLSEAEASFAELGASLYAERCRVESTRVSGRRRAGSDLTATEASVAALVAEGRTNREVAAALSLSVRGVEANLSRIYGKLGVRSRTELAGRLAVSNSVGSHISGGAVPL